MRTGFIRVVSRGVILAFLLVTTAVAAAPAATDDSLPGCTFPLEGSISGTVGSADQSDVYSVELQEDEEITFRWKGSAGTTVHLLLLTPAATSHTSPAVYSSTSTNGSTEVFHYKEAHGKGRYYLIARYGSGLSTYTIYTAAVTSYRNMGVSLYKGQRTVWMDSTRAADVWVLWVRKNRSVDISLIDPTGTSDNFYLYLYTDDGTLQRKSVPETWVLSTADTKSMTYAPMGGGPPTWGPDDYEPLYVMVLRAAGQGYYSLTWSTDPAPAYAARVSGSTRFDCATNLTDMARFPFLEACSDVVVASGDDAAMADPLSAAGLCWAYNAPLVLVSKNSGANSAALNSIQNMRGFNGKVKVHVVGGPNSVPVAVYNELKAAAGGSSSIERIDGANRYEVAKRIAARMKEVRTDAKPGVLVANGADPDKFFDALAMSAIAAHNGMPVALVKKDSIPNETKSILSATTGPRYLAGGTATVSNSVRDQMSATRWSGADRYATARVVADNATGLSLLHVDNVALAAKLPDALSAGANVGFLGGPILLVQKDSVPGVTQGYLNAHETGIRRVWPVGGPMSISNSVLSSVGGM